VQQQLSPNTNSTFDPSMKMNLSPNND